MVVGAFRGVVLSAPFIVMLLCGQATVSAHENASEAHSAKSELLAGDEPSDAMTTGSIAPVSSKSCAAEHKALRMPFADKGHPDEAP